MLVDSTLFPIVCDQIENVVAVCKIEIYLLGEGAGVASLLRHEDATLLQAGAAGCRSVSRRNYFGATVREIACPDVASTLRIILTVANKSAVIRTHGEVRIRVVLDFDATGGRVNRMRGAL